MPGSEETTAPVDNLPAESENQSIMSRSLRIRPDYIQKVKLAVKRKGYPNQKCLANQVGLSRSTVGNYLNGKPVDISNFQEISQFLGLDWQEIAYFDDLSESSTSPNKEAGPQETIIYPNEEKINISINNGNQRIGKDSTREKPTTQPTATPIVTTTQPSITSQKKILILAANPKCTTQSLLSVEVLEIEEQLQIAKKRDQFVLKQTWALHPRDIQQAILTFEPQIIHFSGQGAASEGLMFENETEQEKLIDAEVLADLFKLFSTKVECVILNACYLETQAEAIAKHIDYVIGVSSVIEYNSAIHFVVGFYGALGAGQPIRFAYESGCVAMRLAGASKDLTPILKGKLSKIVSTTSPRHMIVDCQGNGSSSYTCDPSPYISTYAVFDHPNYFGQMILMNPDAYSSFQSMLDDLFINYLSNEVTPYSYGAEWVLSGWWSLPIAVSWEWTWNVGVSVTQLNPSWASLTLPSEINIKPGTHWDIEIFAKTNISQNCFGIVSNNIEIVEILLSNPKAYAMLEERGYFVRREVNEINAKEYKFKYVLGDWLRRDLRGLVLEDANKNLSEDLKHMLKRFPR
jgi:hypothetical protein